MDESDRRDEPQRDPESSREDDAVGQSDHAGETPADTRAGKSKVRLLSDHPLLSSVVAAVISGVILAMITPLFDVDRSEAEVVDTTLIVSKTIGDAQGAAAPPIVSFEAPVSDVQDLLDAVAEDYLPPELPDVGQDSVESLGGRLRASVPTVWVDRYLGLWHDDQGRGLSASDTIVASVDAADFENGWGTPGVWIGVSEELYRTGIDPTEDILKFDDLYRSECELWSEGSFTDWLRNGSFRVWINCGDENSVTIRLNGFYRSMYFVFTGRAVTQADAMALVDVFESIDVGIQRDETDESLPSQGRQLPGVRNP